MRQFMMKEDRKARCIRPAANLERGSHTTVIKMFWLQDFPKG